MLMHNSQFVLNSESKNKKKTYSNKKLKLNYEPNNDYEILMNRILQTRFGQSGGFKFVNDYLHNENYKPIGTSARTSSGKTTCIAQISAMLSLERNLNRITTIITIPQRNSARNMCNYLNSNIQNELFGYAIHGESYIPNTCRVLFCTVGWALMKLLYDASFTFDVFVLDEAHDTNMETSLVLFTLAHMINKLNKKFKMIISSATIAKTEYQTMFKNLSWFDDSTEVDTANTNVKHEMLFLKTNPPDVKSPKYDVFIVNQLVEIIKNATDKSKHIIIHLDGQERIELITSILKERQDMHDFLICPLYSALDKAEQMLAIDKSNIRKIIIATNIIESSITIDDLLYGICMPFHKIPKITDDGYASLELTECSKGNIIQRAGRIGRGINIPGFTKILMTQKSYDKLKDYPKKEIESNPLYYAILKFYGSIFYTKHNVSIYDFFHGIQKTRVDKDTEYLMNYGLIEKLDNIYLITKVGKYIINLATSIPIGHILYSAIPIVPKDYWFSLCIILVMRDLKFYPFYVPRDKRNDVSYINEFTKWYGEDDMDTLFGMLNEYQDQYYDDLDRKWIKDNKLFDQFFHTVWSSAKKLFLSMNDLSIEMVKNNECIAISLDNDVAENNYDYENVYPYSVIKNSMVDLFLANMQDRVFIDNGRNYITMRDYNDMMTKKINIIRDYLKYKINQINKNILHVINVTQRKITNLTDKAKTNFDVSIKELSDIIDTLNSLDLDNSLEHTWNKLEQLIERANTIHENILLELTDVIISDELLTKLQTDQSKSNQNTLPGKKENILVLDSISETDSDSTSDSITDSDEDELQKLRDKYFRTNSDFIENGGTYYIDITELRKSDDDTDEDTNEDDEILSKIKDDIIDIDINQPISKFSIGNNIKYISGADKPCLLIALNVFITVTSTVTSPFKFGYLSGIIIPDKLQQQLFKQEHNKIVNMYGHVKAKLYGYGSFRVTVERKYQVDNQSTF